MNWAAILWFLGTQRCIDDAARAVTHWRALTRQPTFLWPLTSVGHVGWLGYHISRSIMRRHRDSHACCMMACAKSRFTTSGAHQRARPLTGTRICQFFTHSQLPNVRRIVWKECGYTAQSVCTEICNFSVKFQLANSLVQQTTLERYTVCFSCFSSTHDLLTRLTQRWTIALHACIINSRFASCQQVQTSTIFCLTLEYSTSCTSVFILAQRNESQQRVQLECTIITSKHHVATRSSLCVSPTDCKYPICIWSLSLHSNASLHILAHCPVVHGLFSSRGTVLPLPLASLSRLVDHHCRLVTGGLPFLLATSKTTRFLLCLPRNVRAYWLHSYRACTSWRLPNQRVGVHWLRNQCCAPAKRCGMPRIERGETATIPKVKE